MSTFRTASILLAFSLFTYCGNKEESKSESQPTKQESAAQEKVVKPEPEVIQEPEPPVVETPVIEQKPIATRFAFSNDGKFCVQVASGRLDKNVEDRLKYWKNEGFSNAYISTYTEAETQEMWYRIRLGRFAKLKEAKAAAAAVSEQYNISAWADNSSTEESTQSRTSE